MCVIAQIESSYGIEFEIFQSFYTVALTCLWYSKQNQRYPLSLW